MLASVPLLTTWLLAAPPTVSTAPLPEGPAANESEPGRTDPDQTELSQTRAGQTRAGQTAPAHHIGAGYPSCARSRFRCCTTTAPCTRSRPARWLLAALGASAWAGGTAYLLFVGDRVGAGDPGGLLAGAGATATLGALVGAAAGFMGGDAPGRPDRIRPAMATLAGTSGGRSITGERAPGTLTMQVAPTYYFPNDGGRMRLLGSFGGMLGPEIDVLPDGGSGAFDPTFARAGTHIGLALDLATYLPYPILRADRSAHLGAAELRWKPEVQIRHERFSLADENQRTIERTMLLPLTAGVRWHLAPRQRFTVYAGPRFDVLAYSDTPEPDGLERGLERGAPQVGAFYGEAWYDLDIPFRSRLVSHPARAEVNGQLTFGYVHSRFDGRGVNLGGAKGFLGPVHGAFRVRVRPLGRVWALQAGATTWVGNGVGFGGEIGIVLPQIGERGATNKRTRGTP